MFEKLRAFAVGDLLTARCRSCGHVRWAWRRCPCREAGPRIIAAVGLRPCCADVCNRRLVALKSVDDRDRYASFPRWRRRLIDRGVLRYPQRAHMRHERCRACGRNHYRAYMGHLLEPGRVAIR